LTVMSVSAANFSSVSSSTLYVVRVKRNPGGERSPWDCPV